MERLQLPTVIDDDVAYVSYVYSLCRECTDRGRAIPKCKNCFIGYKVEIAYAEDQEPGKPALVVADGPFASLADVVDYTIDDVDWDQVLPATVRRLHDLAANPNPSPFAHGPRARRDRILATLSH